ncbi:hypothetical protein AC626_23480 [Pseudoalteromonas rubra]|uniref:Carrier domain-containing protein n=1 Tax=Pseudoalteromonas rubra TaxID=43658 RepID=A0A0L0ELZ1_9GAMM|nr:hypothetical protein AC626_23480 [Pseudoalteromonas rubra]
MTQIRAKLAREISVRAVFDNQTIRSLASALAEAASAKLPPLVAQSRADHMPLSFAQQRLWFIEQLQGPVTYITCLWPCVLPDLTGNSD